MARVLVLNVEEDKVYETECDELDDFYKHLNAASFDITTRRIGDKVFDIFVDDIGLWKEDPIVSAVDIDFQPALVGNLIFANHDVEGNTTSLSDEDIMMIWENLVIGMDSKGNIHRAVRLNENYNI